MNPTLLLRKLASIGVDVPACEHGTMSAQILSGKLRRATRRRPDAAQVMALAHREQEFRNAAKKWRSDYAWRMKPIGLKMILSSLVAMGVTTFGAVGWYLGKKEASKTLGGPL